jgi:hypothetical protein
VGLGPEEHEFMLSVGTFENLRIQGGLPAIKSSLNPEKTEAWAGGRNL